MIGNDLQVRNADFHIFFSLGSQSVAATLSRFMRGTRCMHAVSDITCDERDRKEAKKVGICREKRDQAEILSMSHSPRIASGKVVAESRMERAPNEVERFTLAVKENTGCWDLRFIENFRRIIA